MAQIARVSGVLVGQIYRDFADKEDLIAAIVERDVSELLPDADLSTRAVPDCRAEMIGWVRELVCRPLDDETRKMLADILSEATRNPRIAAILLAAYGRLRDRLVSAAALWSPEPRSRGSVEAFVDLVLTVAGGLQHRQIFGLQPDPLIEGRMMELIEAQLATISAGEC